MRHLSLFTGAGGGELGAILNGWETIGYVEFNNYCQRVIKARIDDGILPNAPIFGDIRAFNSEGYAASYTGLVDVISGGFPCQPFSVAGKQLGEADERNMWPETIRTIRIVRPRYCFLENVPGLLSHEYIGTIFRELSESGYDARWKVISAAEIGAPHRRDRLWIVAYTASQRWENRSVRVFDYGTQREGVDQTFGGQNRSMSEMGSKGKTIYHVEWSLPPLAIGMVDGVAFDVDRLRAIGNGQVPAVVRAAWQILGERET